MENSKKSFVSVLKRGSQSHVTPENTKSALVLDETCIKEFDFSMSLMGRVKYVYAIPNLHCIIFLRSSFENDERIVWISIEVLPIKAWTPNTFRKIASLWGEYVEWEEADLKSLSCDVTNKDDNNESDVDNKVSKSSFMHENNTAHKDVNSCKKREVGSHSEDPFNIYGILDGQKNNVCNSYSDEPKFPPGFTPDNNDQEKNVEENIKDTTECVQSLSNKLNDRCSNRRVSSQRSMNSHSQKSKVGGSILDLMDELVTVGQTMGYNIAGLGNKAKRRWIKELCQKHRINFASIQETKAESISLHTIKDLWEIRCLTMWEGDTVIMGDFNEVRSEHERFGSMFNRQGAIAFNNFISLACLIDLPLEGFQFFCGNYMEVIKYCCAKRFNSVEEKLQALKIAIKAWSKEANKSDVQSDFVANCQILDGPFIINELLSWCKFKKLNGMIFKVDFEKAFDSVKWDYLDETLKAFGFGSKWCNWTSSCLNNAMGSVLINGSPTLEFQFHKGLKQGLKINLHKSKLMRIGVSSNVVAVAAFLIGCSILTTLFNYLGVKVGSNMSRITSWDDVIFKWVWRFLTDGSSLWARFIKAIFGNKGALDTHKLIPRRSPWQDVIFVIHSLQSKGINLIDFIKKVGNGENTSFWDDSWLGEVALKVLYKRLCALETCKSISVAEKMGHPFLSHSFRRMPRGGVEQKNYGLLCSKVADLVLQNILDRWCWSLEGSQEFSVKSSRIIIDNTILPKAEVPTRWLRVVPIKSLSSKYTGDNYVARSRTLKEVVRTMILKANGNENPLSALNLVDDLQRLGISYHFLDEISSVLENIYLNFYRSDEKWTNMDLNFRSLGFRLLRQHGYHIPQEIFKDVIDVNGSFKGDIIGMLNLYEASYHSVEEESILDDAREFTTKYLKETLENIEDHDIIIASFISHALVFPLQWMVPRVETSWYIEVYPEKVGMNPTVLELAKLDFNILQAVHQEDMKNASRWWKETCWEKFGFARDRLVENFMWTVAENYLPHFQEGRGVLTKVNAMITTIDDVYDVYGTLPELEQFTNIVNSWDINAIEDLPDYMKICFLACYNATNELSYNTLTNKGFFVHPYLKKAWQDLCNSYIIEAKWFNDRYTPTFNEFIENAYMSIGIAPIIRHAYLLTLTSVTEEALQHIERAENMIRNACLIVRLTNDMGTSSDELERGDIPKSIQCYMYESGATEVEAREYIKQFIIETWKKLNKERQEIGSEFSPEFIECVINLARMGHFMYTDGDKHGKPDMFKPYVFSLFVNPIQGVP
nr:(-)-beta-pinene synthase, chloroplastic-like [Tanacetum cinerariifolium]